jgi:hypothetical protein
MAARRFVLDGDAPASKAETIAMSYLLDNHDRLLLGLQPTAEHIAAAAALAADVYRSGRSTSWCAASVLYSFTSLTLQPLSAADQASRHETADLTPAQFQTHTVPSCRWTGMRATGRRCWQACTWTAASRLPCGSTWA